MANLPELTKPQKWQIFTTAGLIGLELILYIGHGLFNGFDYTNHVIMANLPIVLFYGSLPLLFAPAYNSAEDMWTKATQKFTFVGIIAIIVSVFTWVYYSFNEPATGLEEMTSSLARYVGLFAALEVFVFQGMERNRDTE